MATRSSWPLVDRAAFDIRAVAAQNTGQPVNGLRESRAEDIMMLAVSGEVAQIARKTGKSHGGDTRWQTYYIGSRHMVSTPDMAASAKSVGEHPQSHLSEMGPH